MLRELFVSRAGGWTWAALREDRTTVELRVERVGEPPIVGRIVKARVANVLPAIQSAFVDVGLSRNAFLHVSDLLLPGEGRGTPDGVAADVGRVRGPIEERLRPGRELLVQIVRESSAGKGDRVSCRLSLAGRLLVLLPHARRSTVSRRIRDGGERERLQSIVDRLAGAGSGFVVRTAAGGAQESALEHEATDLLDHWTAASRKAEMAQAPATVYHEPALALRMLRDAPPEGLDRVVLDDAEEIRRAERYVRRIGLAGATRIQRHDDRRTIFQRHGFDRDVEAALQPRVGLRSGGDLVVEQTEALVSVDVNSGRSTHGRRLEQTALETNLEAAKEIARQLRLRDLGGVIVVDFIDMLSNAHRHEVVATLEAALRLDPARTKIVGLSETGLLELTRERTRVGPAAALSRACSVCSGRGRIKRPEIVAAEVLAELVGAGTAGAVVPAVRAHPEVVRAIRELLRQEARRPAPDCSLTEDPALGPEAVRITRDDR